MAGELLIVDISYNQKKKLVEAGATEEKKIFHADRTWGEDKEKLDERKDKNGTNNRKNLPPHCYITFNSSNRWNVQAFCSDKVKKAQLAEVLKKTSRPTCIVTRNSYLSDWPQNAVDIFLEALEHGNITIEYYKQDGSPVMNVFGTYSSGWEKINE